jgi:hypothetical protein
MCAIIKHANSYFFLRKENILHGDRWELLWNAASMNYVFFMVVEDSVMKRLLQEKEFWDSRCTISLSQKLQARGKHALGPASPLNTEHLQRRAYPQIHRNLIRGRWMGKVARYTTFPSTLRPNSRMIMQNALYRNLQAPHCRPFASRDNAFGTATDYGLGDWRGLSSSPVSAKNIHISISSRGPLSQNKPAGAWSWLFT